MKIKFVMFTIALTAILLCSCQRNERTQAPSVTEQVEMVSRVIESGFALLVNTSFYSAVEEDTGEETDRTRWAASMALGERVEVWGERKATFAGDGRVYNFLKVRRDNGILGLALTSQIAVGGNLAVVIDERANLFRTPRAVDVSGVIISRRTVVVYYPETENNGFVEIRGYDPVNRFYVQPNNNFVRLSSLSVNSADIQSSILLQTALPLSNQGQERIRRDALLESALLDYPDSEFYMEIFEIVNPRFESQIETQIEEIEIIESEEEAEY